MSSSKEKKENRHKDAVKTVLGQWTCLSVHGQTAANTKLCFKLLSNTQSREVSVCLYMYVCVYIHMHTHIYKTCTCVFFGLLYVVLLGRRKWDTFIGLGRWDYRGDDWKLCKIRWKLMRHILRRWRGKVHQLKFFLMQK